MREHTGAPAPDTRISVAVITRDRPHSALHTLDRLAELPERPPVLVVDNGTDPAVTEALRAHPVGARVLAPGHNTGALGRNLAVRHAGTRYVAFSDDDSWWRPGALRRAADLLDAHPGLGLLAARSLVGPEEREDPMNELLARSPLPPQPGLPGRPVLGFLGCACVVRRRAHLGVGGYHPLLFFGAEETLLAYDLAAAGWGVSYDPSVTAHHHPDPGARPGRPALLRRNQLLTAWLRRPVRVAARQTALLGTEAARGEAGAAAALRGALVRAPAALRQRRRLPPRVEQRVRLLERHARAGHGAETEREST
ncbi:MULTISPECIES: glycosyltransferase family 2 protein [Streptomyces]|uniref:glycosyltransferase family 2 protein n=1 Tax=Streptomyces TaxID=1883 RepID=UPI00081BC09F|nr:MULTISPECIES: glycosyltransferase [unclassified Streptomyces]MYQ53830.1 glycosyltransferase [Streptomyces sp. SID4941]SCE12942.1 Glycosyltransferase, GT2 family [Streptomyces sp. PalvLS-984]SDC92816.1 Glycosyltransferase, GT2 family [Streptomyces sp. AmelKG-A3]